MISSCLFLLCSLFFLLLLLLLLRILHVLIVLDNTKSIRLVKWEYFQHWQNLSIIVNINSLVRLQIPLDNARLSLFIAILEEIDKILTEHKELIFRLFYYQLSKYLAIRCKMYNFFYYLVIIVYRADRAR